MTHPLSLYSCYSERSIQDGKIRFWVNDNIITIVLDVVLFPIVDRIQNCAATSRDVEW